MRVQFYPSYELETRLLKESTELGVSVSVLVNEVLNKHYGLVPANTLTDIQIEKIVIDEILDYVNKTNNESEFDLNKASPTYCKIDMIYAGKPHILKARLGKCFAKLVGTGDFANVEQVMLSNGKPKRTVGNRAAIYRIKEVKRRV